MKKIKINMWVDIIAFLIFIPVVVSSIVLASKISSGSNLFLGLAKPAWTALHTATGFAFIALIIIHFLLHLDWVKCIPHLMKSK